MIQRVLQLIQGIIDAHRRSLIVVPWILLGGVAIASLLPLDALAIGVSSTDKMIHALVYGALLGAFALFYPLSLLNDLAIRIISYGVVIEVLQILIPRRTFDLWDIVANSCGVLGISMFMRWWYFPAIDDVGH